MEKLMNMDSFPFVVVILIVMILLNRIFAVPQQIRLNKDLAKLKRHGPIASVGVEKSFLGAKIAVLICDEEGHVLEAYRVDGKSVTSTYRLDEAFPYEDCFEAVNKLGQKDKLSTQERAYLSAATYVKEGLSSTD